MRFDPPNAVAAMNNAISAVGEDGDCWDTIGEPLDKPVEETLPAYDEKLSLNLSPSAGDKRLEVGGLCWGKIEKDAARLHGLAAAIDNISAVINKGKLTLSHDWKGESFDAFRVAIEKVEKTLSDYAAAVRTTADGLSAAMDNIRTLYMTYRDECTGTVLNFGGFVPPEDWEGKEHEQDARTALVRKIHEFYTATDALKEPVGETLVLALENLRVLAETKVFSALQLPAATASAAHPGGGGVPALVESAPVEQAAAVERGDPELPAGAERRETVEVKEGDRTISVSSPGGDGHVTVTVEDGSGAARTYDLDFDAASGLPPRPPADGAAGPDGDVGPTDPKAERVPANSNGICTIEDGPLTITAERPLFNPGTVKLVVDDGTGEPTTYTLNLAEREDASAPEPGEAADQQTDAKATAPTPTPTGELAAQTAPTPVAISGPAAADATDPGAPTAPTPGTTSPQALTSDPTGAVSGGPVPDQSTGEAELASAGEGEPAGPAGGSLPMTAGRGGRAGTGWSVHGDLFDNGDPVYSMHGVLGEDDLEGR